MQKVANFLISILTLFLLNNANAKTIIAGKLINYKGKNESYFLSPIDGFSNNVYNPTAINFSPDLSFKINLKINKPGFVYVNFPNGRIELFISPGDSVYLLAHYIDSMQYGMMTMNSLKITGSNKEGNIFCANNRSVILDQQLLIDNIFAIKKYTAVSQLFNASTEFIDSLCQPLDTLYTTQKISSFFYKKVLANVQGTLSTTIPMLFNVFLVNKDKNMNNNFTKALRLNKDFFTETNFDSFKIMFYKKYDPLDTFLLSSSLGLYFCENYYTDIYKGLIKTDASYDSSFNFMIDDDKPLGYMHGRFLEKLWETSLYFAGGAGVDDETINKSFHMFTQYFPNSAFIPYLKERLGKTISDDKLQTTASSVIYLKNAGDTSFYKLIKNNFSGSYVFVDLWATWCIPCVEEFAYKNQLHNYLQSKNIKALYISINDSSDLEKWKKYVDLKKLAGYHFLASEQLGNDIKAKIYHGDNVTIPRYILVNPQGEIVNNDLPRPSDFNNLKKTIDKLVK